MLSPRNHPHGGGPAIYDHPSRSYMLYLHAGLVPTGYLYNTPPIPQGRVGVSYTLHQYLQRITAHKVPL